MPRSEEGATFEDILRYVMKHTRLTETRARHMIIDVLKAGVATNRIKKTPHGTYVLTTSRPAALVRRIKEPRFSDSSSDESDKTR